MVRINYRARAARRRTLGRGRKFNATGAARMYRKKVNYKRKRVASKKPVRRVRFKAQGAQNYQVGARKYGQPNWKRLSSLASKLSMVQNGERYYKAEVNDLVASAPVNRKQFLALPSINDQANIATILGQTGGDAIQLGSLYGTGSYSTTKYLSKWRIADHTLIYKFKNLAEVDIMLQCWEIVATKDRPLEAAGAGQVSTPQMMAIADLYEGYFSEVAVGSAASATGGSGQGVIDSFNVVNGYMNSLILNGGLRGKQFKTHWKVLKTKQFKLAPGDDLKWKMKSHSFTFDPASIEQWNNALDNQVMKGRTRMLLIAQYGGLAISTTSSKAEHKGTYLAYETYETCRVMRLEYGNRSGYQIVTNIDPAAEVYGMPVETVQTTTAK